MTDLGWDGTGFEAAEIRSRGGTYGNCMLTAVLGFAPIITDGYPIDRTGQGKDRRRERMGCE